MDFDEDILGDVLGVLAIADETIGGREYARLVLTVNTLKVIS